MTTANPEETAGAAPERLSLRSWIGAVAGERLRTLNEALARPLTSYYLLVGTTVLLLVIGLIMVMSASSVYAYIHYDGHSYAVVKKQLMWVTLGAPVAFIASRISQRWVRRLVWPGFILSLGLLVMTAKMGVSVYGNKNWLALGPIQIQPSEIAKLALILWAAHIFAMKERRLHSVHAMVMPVVPGILLATGLVLIGHDLGTSLIFGAILLGLLWVAGLPLRYFTVASLVVGTAAVFFVGTSHERLARIENFLDPFKDLQGAGWQAGHGLYALSSGSWFGQGIGASQQKWGDLPEAHTDFIFAVLGEELGLVGTLLVVTLFLVLAFAAIRVARQTRDPFVRYVTFGVVIWLVGQAIINIGMVLAFLPVIGLPLPLVSYGGSALLPSLAALGLVIGFARREPEAALALAQRKRSRSTGLSAR
ncbi:putative lipid II flippase FtsW [Nocardioides nematodiphilus]|uniref:putative lipid II flippase FtsW n=1 Tax=Nocardioides nematodiphilus TaxID=2849669 RepID=UPI001CD922B3|nr:putative lipid II flippase FtsW [Nocardioides nematodiphilus]MCA1982490.1 putative lipid II flippase FtsW [Nocardioides nematodiphilus]